MTNNTKRGGKRANAGAPKKDNPAKSRTMRLTDDDYSYFKSLGGVNWLRNALYVARMKNE